MTDEKKTLARYVRNADEANATQAIRFNGDGRDDVYIGQVGYFTDQELENAPRAGVILQPISEEDAEAKNLALPRDPDAPDPNSLEAKTDAELKELAEAEGIDLKGARSKEDKVEAINAGRAAAYEAATTGEAGLPATVVKGLAPALEPVPEQALAAQPDADAGGSQPPAKTSGSGPAQTTTGGAAS